MASKTSTPTAEIVVADEITEVTLDSAEETMESATDALVQALDPRQGIFVACEESYNYKRAGLDLKVLAQRVSDAIIARDFPGLPKDDELVIAARKKGVIEGGANVTERSLLNRALAWDFVVNVAQVTPTPANIATAFKVTSVGRGRTILEADTKPAMENSGLEGDERDAEFDVQIEQARRKMRATSPRSAANRKEAAFQVENVLKFLKELPTKAFTDAQIEQISEALQQCDYDLQNPEGVEDSE